MTLRHFQVLLAVALAGFPAPAMADAAAGRTKAASCTACHGPDGLSRLPNAPHIAGQPEFYLAKELKAFRDGTRQDPMMTLIAKPLSDQDIADLAAWFASIEVTAKVPD